MEIDESKPWSPPEQFDDYRLIRLLGRGGMGEVYLAHDMQLERQVAVKFIAGEPSAELRRSFMVEARAIARLSHPNVVSIYRVGEVDRRPYLVSEYIDGRTLDRLELPLEGDEVLTIARSLVRGLVAAHRRGVLHRDLKPANAILGNDGEAKLLDFGVAKLLDGCGAAVGAAWASAPAAGVLTTQQLDRAPTLPAAALAHHTGGLVGTPLYFAPELWRGEPATPRSEIYALGVLLYELCAGEPPLAGRTIAELRALAGTSPVPPLAERAPHIDGRLAAVIERCLAAAPADRFASADELHQALQLLQAPLRLGSDAFPYRGLQPFEAEHRGIFFGRDGESRLIAARLRTDSFVLVAGDSGVGKSSLVRAGVLPLLGDGALGGDVEVATVITTPGRRPLAALATALAAVSGANEDWLVRELSADPLAVARQLRQAAATRRFVLFVDQLEELVTLAEADAAAQAAEALAVLAGTVPQLRLIGTVRSDFLARLSALPGLGDGVTRALYLLRPLSTDAVREAIVGPATLAGVHFESELLVDELVASAGEAGGELPLLQFALAQLWERRDVARGLICTTTLQSMGGVAGALARHADGVLGRLAPEQRPLARRILTALVTPQGTRARCTAAELVGADAGAATGVLETLVQGRLITAEDSGSAAAPTYQIAHDVLVEGWDTLRGWRGHQVEREALRRRLGRAAQEWERLGRSPEALWSGRLLAEVRDITGPELEGIEADFLEYSRRSARRQRLWRRVLVLGMPLLLGLGYAGARLGAQLHLAGAIQRHLDEAATLLAQARAEEHMMDALRGDVFAAFDHGHADSGEAAWTNLMQLTAVARARFGQASQELEMALALDGSRREVRRQFAEILDERARLAERDHRLAERDDLVRRMRAYDDGGTLQRRWSQAADLTVETTPAGAQVRAQRYVDDAGRLRLGPAETLGVTPLADRSLPPGSYLLLLETPGRPSVRYPLLLGPGQRHRIAVSIPAAVPEGYAYVAPGSFLYGSNDDDDLRRSLLAAEPLHSVATPAYLIGRHEVTFAEWLAFLQSLPPAERLRRRPHTPAQAVSTRAGASLDVVPDGDGVARLTLQPTTYRHAAAAGEPIRYVDRARRATQDWLRMPVSGISWDDARAYGAWLDRTGRLAGARPCNEHEWERAYRGADGRLFPTGSRIDADDADFAATYGRKAAAFGPDQVGAHPASDSPFGVADMAGNVWEWVASMSGREEIVIRGGSWYHNELTLRSNNREPAEPELRSIVLGVRICASVVEQ